jgi:hypothetical protein
VLTTGKHRNETNSPRRAKETLKNLLRDVPADPFYLVLAKLRLLGGRIDAEEITTASGVGCIHHANVIHAVRWAGSLYGRPETRALSGLSNREIDRRVADGRFPRPYYLGPVTKRWSLREVCNGSAPYDPAWALSRRTRAGSQDNRSTMLRASCRRWLLRLIVPRQHLLTRCRSVTKYRVGKPRDRANHEKEQAKQSPRRQRRRREPEDVIDRPVDQAFAGHVLGGFCRSCDRDIPSLDLVDTIAVFHSDGSGCCRDCARRLIAEGKLRHAEVWKV